MYKVHWSQGQGDSVGPEFNTLEEALIEVMSEAGNASQAIELPDGSWYEFTEQESALLGRAFKLNSEIGRYMRILEERVRHS